MAPEETSILTAIANWIGAVGVPILGGLALRLISWGHRQDLAIQNLENSVKELQKNGTRIDQMQNMLQRVSDDVIELKTLMSIRFGGENSTRGGRRAGDE